MICRPATLADVNDIVAMGGRFRAQSVYRDRVADNPAQVRALTERMVSGPDSVVLVAEDVDGLAGMLAILTFPHHMSGERIAGEVAWWVEPAKRGIGLRLLREAERWARAQGATAIQMIAPTPDVEAIYSRLGYEPIERTFQRRIA